MERLQKIISQAGIASRRASEQLMLDGRVTVNGATVQELGTKADLAVDDIRVDGRRIKAVQQHRYLLLNKPRGYVTTRSDPQRRPTVLDLLRGVKECVYPVGRLDYDTEGLLVMTNDGDLAARLTHPRHGITRVYEARVLGVPDDHDIARLSKGILIDGRRTEQAEVKLLAHGRDAEEVDAAADDPRGTQPSGEEHVRGDRTPGEHAAPRGDRAAARLEVEGRILARADPRRDHATEESRRHDTAALATGRAPKPKHQAGSGGRRSPTKK